MDEPNWLTEKLILSQHSKIIERSKDKDLSGLLDPPKFSATCAKPRHLYCYGTEVDLFDLAAAYGFGFARNHCFVSANKRIAFTTVYYFLQLNGFILIVDKEEAINYIDRLAQGEIDQEEFAEWLRLNSHPR